MTVSHLDDGQRRPPVGPEPGEQDPEEPVSGPQLGAFQDDSPLGEEIRIRNVSFRVIGVLSRKGASMLGMDQDDVVLAPWTSIKYRVGGAGRGNVNPSASASSRTTNTNHKVAGTRRLYSWEAWAPNPVTP